MLAIVHRRPPPSASRANTIRVTTGERPRTWMNEPKTEPTPKRHPCPAAARASPYPGYLPDGLTACDRGARPVGGSPAALPGPVHHVTITVGRGTHPLGQGVRLGQQCQVLSTGLGADSLWPASAPPWWCTALMSYARAPPPPCRPSRPVRCSPTPSAPGSQGCRALRPRAVLARVHRRRALQARRGGQPHPVSRAPRRCWVSRSPSG